MKMKRRDFLKAGMIAMGAATTVALGEKAISQSALAAEKEAPDHKLFALKYAGPFTSSVAMVIFNTEWDKQIQRNYYIWAVQGGGNTVVYDCGVRPGYAAEREWLRTTYVSPDKVLERIGIKAGNVQHLVISHIHFDHNGGLELFPKAKVYVQRREFDFWVYDPAAKKPPLAHISDSVAIGKLRDLASSDRLVLVDGDRKLLPGIELLLTPGHTIALQSMAVKTAKGLAILTSDCAHVHRSYELDTPSCLITNMPEWLRSYDKLRRMVNGNIKMLFPGHDKKMLDDYPKVAEDVTQLV